MLQTPAGSRDGDSQQASKPASQQASKPTSPRQGVNRVQAEPTRLRGQISAQSCTGLAQRWAQSRLAPAMAAPMVRSVAASHARPKTQTNRALDRRQTGPQFHVVCLLPRETRPGSRYALNDTACTGRQYMHKSADGSITSSTAAVSERRQTPRTPECAPANAGGRAGGWDETVSSVIEGSQHGMMAPDQTREENDRELNHCTPVLPRGDPPYQGKPCNAVRRDRRKRNEGEQGPHARC